MMDYATQMLAEARKAITTYPEHRCEIIESYHLARAEIEDGESPAHEYELFMSSLNEIRKETVHG